MPSLKSKNSPRKTSKKHASTTDGVFQAKATAYARAYYPSALRGKIEVKVDHEAGVYKLSKRK